MSTAIGGEPIVRVESLRKTYSSRNWLGQQKRIDALCGVSLDAYGHDVFGLLGPNGAGKTTLIKSLLGVIRVSSGNASLFGMPIGSREARAKVGYLPESLRVDRHHTARSALHYYGCLSNMGGKEIRRRSDELLELVGLKGRDQESIRRFSKGMYQRLGLAQALMHDPDLLVLDEPTDGLDPVGRNEVRKVINRLRDLGKTIFLNSHILQEVELVCNRVAILNKGEILTQGSINELLSQSQQQTRIEFEIVTDQLQSNRPSSEHHETLLACFRHEPFPLLDIEVRASRCQVTLSPSPRVDTHASQPTPIASNVYQPYIDRAVDQLRSAGFSISSISLQRNTLEDTFMRLVGQSDPESEASKPQ